MKKFILLMLVLILTTLCFTSCDDEPGLCEDCCEELAEGDYLFGNFQIIKVYTNTIDDMVAYEVVDNTTNVVYLYTFYDHGERAGATMTPLYNRDGSLRKYGGK